MSERKREIKFRGWSKNANKMFENISIFTNLMWDKYYKTHVNKNAYDDIELMQYTGLLDKNGKEIYEGDIIKDYGEIVFGKIGYDGEWNGLSGFGFKKNMYENEFLELNYYDCPSTFEIIGNIYENPDLIKGRQNET